MSIVFIIIGAVGLLILILSSDKQDLIFGVCLCTTLILVGIVSFFKESEPEAIDVYRGKTELKITGTYKDSIFIPTDSIVIFKRM